MQLAVALAVIGVVLVAWVQVCLHLATWLETRAGGPRRRWRAPRARLRLLPEGHRPPPGLGPISPSERFLTQEAARGLRELQVFLVDRAA